MPGFKETPMSLNAHFVVFVSDKHVGANRILLPWSLTPVLRRRPRMLDGAAQAPVGRFAAGTQILRLRDPT